VVFGGFHARRAFVHAQQSIVHIADGVVHRAGWGCAPVVHRDDIERVIGLAAADSNPPGLAPASSDERHLEIETFQ
jgi:hypothetical protein